MALFYSKSKNGFFDDSIHIASQIPSDAKEISQEVHSKILDEQACGRKIVSDAFGYPKTTEIKEKKLTKKQQNDLKIKDLEESMTLGLLREAILGKKESIKKLQEIQDEIERLRG